MHGLYNIIFPPHPASLSVLLCDGYCVAQVGATTAQPCPAGTGSPTRVGAGGATLTRVRSVQFYFSYMSLSRLQKKQQSGQSACLCLCLGNIRTKTRTNRANRVPTDCLFLTLTTSASSLGDHLKRKRHRQ